MSETRLVPLGVIGRPHGLRGEVRVHPYHPGSDLLGRLGALFVLQDGVIITLPVHTSRRANDVWLFAFEGFEKREAAERLRGVEVKAPRELFPPLPEGEYYQVDLEGLAAESAEGEPVGFVERVIEYPASVVLAVRGEDGLREVPMTPPYVVAVELKQRKVIVDRIEDLEIEREN